jgi:hypothetical protein
LIPLIAIVELVRAHKVSSRVMQNRIKFMLLALFVGIVGGTTNVPLVYDVPLEPVGIPLVPLYLFLISYAIYKYRLMEINYFIYQGLSYAFLSVLFIIPAVVLFSFLLKMEYGESDLALLGVS